VGRCVDVTRTTAIRTRRGHTGRPPSRPTARRIALLHARVSRKHVTRPTRKRSALATALPRARRKSTIGIVAAYRMMLRGLLVADSRRHRAYIRLRRAAIAASEVVGLQALSQLATAVAGFAILRWLSVADYACYTLVFGFTSTLNFVVDLGFPQAVIAVIGRRADVPKVVAAYLSAGRSLRVRTLTVILPVSSVLFVVLAERHAWPTVDLIVGLAVVSIIPWLRSVGDFYAIPLLLRGEHRRYMIPQTVAAILRLGTVVVAWLAGVFSAAVAILTFLIVVVIPAAVFRRGSTPISLKPEPRARRDLFRYALPLAPMLLYTALQSQILVFVASATSGVEQLASIGALSRLAQIFALLAVVNGVLVMPRLARMPAERIRRRIAEILTIVAFCCVVASASAWLLPGPFLALLGSHYASVGNEIGPYIFGSALGFAGGMIFAIDSACRFIYWWLAVGLIVTVIAVQTVCALTLNLSTLPHLVLLQIITSGVELCVAGAGLAYGLARGPRPIASRLAPSDSATDLG
jgi:O-antigen/teichoic acid export membrane protein